jgi:hypothetical protein
MVILNGTFCKADHKYDHIVKYIERCHANKKVKSVDISSSYTFRGPRTMVIVVIDANIALSTVVGSSLHDETALFAKSMMLSNITFYFIRFHLEADSNVRFLDLKTQLKYSLSFVPNKNKS